jgi:RHS repeat-associated protein
MPDGGTFPDGSTLRGSLDLARYEWPARHYTAYFREPYPVAERLWLGSIVTGQKNASGLFYRRNRYFDPQANQFTQEDPIGIAGGLNTYGFAGGDPVSYSDPYGLCPPCGPESRAEVFVQAAEDWFADLGNRLIEGAQELGELTGLNDFVRAAYGWDPQDPAGLEVSTGGRLLAAGALILRTSVPEASVMRNLGRTLRRAQGADITVTRVGRFYRASWEIAGDMPGQSHTRWTKDISPDGRTIRIYHDSYDRAGRFQHRQYKFPDDHIAY